MTTPTTTALDEQKVQDFVDRLVSDAATAMHGALTYIGDRLGLFKLMATTGPITCAELSSKSGLNKRYLQEWLGSMVSAQYIEYDPKTTTFFFPPEHAQALANEDFAGFMGGLFQELVPCVSVAPQVADAFRSGKGVPQSAYSADTFEGIERITMPWYKNQLVQNWLPTMPNVVAALMSGCAALDVGCGSGQAAIALAQAFPKTKVHGYDNHPGSIEKAKANAKQAGVSERITFELNDCSKLPENRFDFITTFDVIHDSADPLGLLSSIYRALKDTGTFLMLEMNASDKLENNISPLGKLLYSISTLYCMTTSLADGGAGIGALMGEPKARELTGQAGFTHFRKLPIEDPLSVLYELKK